MENLNYSQTTLMENTTIQKLTIQWLDFNTHKDAIRNLRKEVFVEEQSFDEFVLFSENDSTGFHLGLFDHSKLVSVLSLFLHKCDSEYLKTLGLKTNRPFVIQYSRRAELPQYRSLFLAKLLVAHAVKSVVELFAPDLMFATLMGRHISLRDMYIKAYGFNRHFSTNTQNGDMSVIVLDDKKQMKNIVLKLRNDSLNLSHKHRIELPNLSYHIKSNPELDELYSVIKEDENNHYLEHLSLKDELPRLSAQARMLYVTQSEHWKNLIHENPSIESILDLGCGPGVYLSLLSKIPELKHVKFTGIDYSDDLITYAQFAHPKLKWVKGSVYSSPFENESFDLVHASFLFIHLLKPYLAIKEAYRLLKSGGLLYITDVNDDTFKGPPEIVDMVNSHDDIYEGNRRIMRNIDALATQGGFELLHSYIVEANNTGIEGELDYNEGVMKLGKNTMWAMFSFMGQRDEIKDKFHKAQDVYFSNKDAEISIETHTRIYKKI